MTLDSRGRKKNAEDEKTSDDDDAGSLFQLGLDGREPLDDVPLDLQIDPENELVGRVLKVKERTDEWFVSAVEDGEESDTDDDMDDWETEEENEDSEEENERRFLQDPPVARTEDQSFGAAAAVLFPVDKDDDDVPTDMDEQYYLADRSGLEVNRAWSTPLLPSETQEMGDCELKRILQSNDRKSLGVCINFDKNEKHPMLEDKELSMLRLIEHVSMKPRNDPQNHPSRQSVVKKVAKLYGQGCQPVHFQMTAADEVAVINIQEDPCDKTKKANGDDETLVEMSEERIANSDAYKALPKEIDNRERFMVDLISFSAKNQILDLLGDTDIFGDLSNLVVNPSNPFLPYKNPNKFADEILDGSWYGDTIKRLTNELPTDPFVKEVEFLLPIIMYVDKTGTCMNQRCPLEPLMMTTAIIRRSLRTDPSSWRALGFIPDLETRSSAEQTHLNRQNQAVTSQAYHCALGHLLQGLEEVQNKGIVHWLQLGKHKKKVRLRPEVAFVINDGKSADMITLRYAGTVESRRVSRCCQTKLQDCDQVTRDCEYVDLSVDKELSELFRRAGMSAKEVQEDPVLLKERNGERINHEAAKSLVEDAKQKLMEKDFHPVRNAFLARCIRFGLDPRNIWGANPIDLMHAYQSGVLMYEVKMVLDTLKPKDQVKLETLQRLEIQPEARVSKDELHKRFLQTHLAHLRRMGGETVCFADCSPHQGREAVVQGTVLRQEGGEAKGQRLGKNDTRPTGGVL